MAGRKEAKQKAGPSGQKEKNRKEAESPTRAKNIEEDAGRRPAQDMQKREAHKDLKDRGELKKSGMTKRRQARKVATMVKRLKKNPEGWGVATPNRGGGRVDVWRRLGRTTAGHSDRLRSISGNAVSGGVASSRQLDGKDPAQRKRRKPG
jgi:hypothetical protein